MANLLELQRKKLYLKKLLNCVSAFSNNTIKEELSKVNNNINKIFKI